MIYREWATSSENVGLIKWTVYTVQTQDNKPILLTVHSQSRCISKPSLMSPVRSEFAQPFAKSHVARKYQLGLRKKGIRRIWQKILIEVFFREYIALVDAYCWNLGSIRTGWRISTWLNVSLVRHSSLTVITWILGLDNWGTRQVVVLMQLTMHFPLSVTMCTLAAFSSKNLIWIERKRNVENDVTSQCKHSFQRIYSPVFALL